jgi:hypothetical protein
MKIPNVNSIVAVTTRYPNIYYYSNEKYTYKTFRGKVVKNEKWVNGDAFSVDTGDSRYPVSIISLKCVHALEVISGGSSEIRKFKVEGSKGYYMVTLNNDQYSCQCVGFKYYAKCKHITAVVKKQQNTA